MAPLTLSGLRRAFQQERLQPRDLVSELRARADAASERNAWIHRLTDAELAPYIDGLASRKSTESPLWGVPFAIKDNIDVEGVPTTAGCPDYAYTPERSAAVVQRLVDAGAIPLGKTNMDQFATGLVGTRTPYGATRNAVDPSYIAGGSSSGSAVAVKLGLAAFALGTDTAGSGRVPAAFNELVGFKPSRGWWSTRGVVPACRTLDCVSVFANTVADARAVARVAGGFDADDPFARRIDFNGFDHGAVHYGCLDPARLPPMDDAYLERYAGFVDGLPGSPVAVDPGPFLEAGALLYEGPWLAERQAAVGSFLEQNPDAVHPVTRTVIEAGKGFSATEVFRAQYRLAELKRRVEQVFEQFDVLAMPTAPAIFTVAEVESEPFATNTRLGTFTNSVNLLDLCAVAIPAGRIPTGMPFGVTLTSGAGRDYALLNAAAELLGEPVAPSGVRRRVPKTACDLGG